jgi:cellulose synthase operon protein C
MITLRFILSSVLFVSVGMLLLHGCGVIGKQDTIADLNKVEIEIKEEYVEGSLEKAMESYQKFLLETPEGALTPEAIRRLADLKIEKEYGVPQTGSSARVTSAAPVLENITEAVSPSVPAADVSPAAAAITAAPVTAIIAKDSKKKEEIPKSQKNVIAKLSESQKAFEKRATEKQDISGLDGAVGEAVLPEADLQTAGAMEAIELYKKLLVKYPYYERNDQVLYQLSRAYEETGQIEKAMGVLNQLVKDYPRSRHFDEAQFRRAEYFFTRKKYLDAEEAYQAVLDVGIGSVFYELALYKQGWVFFKQDMYEEALIDFIALLDYKIATGFDFENIENPIEKKRIDDTYRVISLSFSYLGGPQAIVDHFDKHGLREYEASIYSHLGEYYLETRRYADAAQSYNLYVERNPLNKVAPYFHMRVIEIYLAGGFPKLVVDGKKNFASNYGLRSTYWTFHDINSYPDVLGYVKSNLTDLANHYHALYQDKRLVKDKAVNFTEAAHWYRAYLDSFPEDAKAPAMNFQLAELLLENGSFRDAALQYERTAYNYPAHEKSAAAGYAAVFAYREHLKSAPQSERVLVKREIIRSSLQFADTYPQHDKAALVMVAAVDDLYELKDYVLAVKIGRKMLDTYPNAEQPLRRSAWLIVAHGSFDLTEYKDAELGYTQVLSLSTKDDASLVQITENLAASIYKQGEQARKLEDYKLAAEHFLRVGQVTPNANVRPTADYDAAAALISLKSWQQAADVLKAFRQNFPKHGLLPEVTKKLAIVYREDGQSLFAAAEFERIEKETTDVALRREALLEAADLYERGGDQDSALKVYQRFVAAFPEPIDFVLETRQKIADIFKMKNDIPSYTAQLDIIVKADAKAGNARTDRTRYLAANAALYLTQPVYDEFIAIKLVKPFKKNLDKKKTQMKVTIDAYTRLVDYGVGEVTAAVTYQIAELYLHFNRALMESERPDNLNAEELEQYNLAIEEQAYPFEEKAIKVHEKNMELLSTGIYNSWIDKSIAKLAIMVPARYARAEEPSGFVSSLTQQANSTVAPAPVSQPVM